MQADISHRPRRPKTPFVALDAHWTRDWFAAVSADGLLTVYDCAQQIMMYEMDFQAPAAIVAMAFHPTHDVLILLDAAGKFQAFLGIGTQVCPDGILGLANECMPKEGCMG